MSSAMSPLLDLRASDIGADTGIDGVVVKRSLAALTVALAASVVGTFSACAQPRTFPDLTKFTEIAPDSSIIATGRVGHVARFATPDGLRCDADGELVECQSHGLGVIPAFPPDATHLASTTQCPSERVASSASGSTFSYAEYCNATAVLPTLNPGQKVTIGKTACVVGDDRLTACTNGPHGFVVQPSGSWTF